jgi:hypothetical protein
MSECDACQQVIKFLVQLGLLILSFLFFRFWDIFLSKKKAFKNDDFGGGRGFVRHKYSYFNWMVSLVSV